MDSSKFEANILKEHDDMFPTSFINCVENGVGWLCFHNGITYQTSLVVKTDKMIYNTSDSDILKIGLIDTSKPLSGLTYYGINKVEENADTINGNTTYLISAKYQTPAGIKLTIIPFQFYQPSKEPSDDNLKEFSSEWFDKFFKELDPIWKSKSGLNIQESINYVKGKVDNNALGNYYTKQESDDKYKPKSE